MNKLLTGALTFLFAVTLSVAFGKDFHSLPPDSTTSIVDKASAMIHIEEGRTLYDEGKIKNALTKFREAMLKDPHSWKASFWTGKCHYRLNSYGYALKYAKQAVSLRDEKVNSEIYFLLAESYHRMGNIDSALTNYQIANEKLNKIRANELMIPQHISECEFALKQETPKQVRKRTEGTVNSGYDDYNVTITNEGKGMYFVSRRSNTTGGGMNPDDQIFFEDTYTATWNAELEEWENVTNELGKINSDGFDALNWISPDGLTAYMTLNTEAIKTSKSTHGSDICELKMSDKGTWNTPKIIKNSSVNTSFFEGAPSLTADGQTMYFSSDRKGEKKSMDIYVVERRGKKWGDAKPLSDVINTKGYETTPFITPDGRYLFFSSNGHLGMGGLDVYVSENLGDSWSEPVNLGSGVNSVNNDYFFKYYPSIKKAYLSGLKIFGNKSSVDIFEVDMTDFKFPKAK